MPLYIFLVFMVRTYVQKQNVRIKSLKVKCVILENNDPLQTRTLTDDVFTFCIS